MPFLKKEHGGSNLNSKLNSSNVNIVSVKYLEIKLFLHGGYYYILSYFLLFYRSIFFLLPAVMKDLAQKCLMPHSSFKFPLVVARY